jgi:preprotein translocase subunit YajC
MLPSPLLALLASPLTTAPLTALTSLQEEGGAAPEEAPSGGLFGGGMLPILLIFVIFYVVMIAPERKQRKRREAMIAAIKKGDRVITTSGMHAVVAQVQDDVLTLQVADGVRIKFSRASVQTVAVDEKQEQEEKAAAK